MEKYMEHEMRVYFFCQFIGDENMSYLLYFYLVSYARDKCRNVCNFS
jgi:hypothetical protein